MTDAVWTVAQGGDNSWLNSDWVKNLKTTPQFPIPPNKYRPDGIGWYQVATFSGTAADYVNGRAVVTPIPGATVLRASNDAPMTSWYRAWAHDGVKGMITNNTNQPMMVEILHRPSPGSLADGASNTVNQAILLPGDRMPYLFSDENNPENKEGPTNETLRFYRVDEATGQPVGKATTLQIDDGFWFDPDTYLTFDNGHTNFRKRWKQGEQHHEVWGATSVFIRRETNKPGWDVPASVAWYRRETQGSTATGPITSWEMRDWAIYTVRIDGLG